MSGFAEHAFRIAGGSPGLWSPAGRGLLAGLAAAVALSTLALSPASSIEPLPAPVLIVDVNTAPAGVLSALPNIGPALAREINDRRAEAPFRTASDLSRRARGVGPVTLARLARHIRTGPLGSAGLSEPAGRGR